MKETKRDLTVIYLTQTRFFRHFIFVKTKKFP